MKWSWRIGRVAGIDVYLHATFLILVGYVALSAYLRRGDLADVLENVLFIGCFFGIVVLHELGHCLTARRFGIQTHDITLLPIGGLARLARLPDKPTHELLIAIAGPAVNWLLALVLYGLVSGRDSGPLVRDLRLVGGNLLVNLFIANAAMGLFNLVPAFPMDGGRVLRSLLAYRIGFPRATEVAATVGQALAWGFGAIGLFMNHWLLFVALFVFLGAEAEADMMRTKSILGDATVEQVMITRFCVLAPDDPLRRAVQYVVEGFQQDFPVVQDERVIGVLTRRRLLAGLAREGENAPVASFMVKEFRAAMAWETAEEAFQRLQDCDCRTMPVLRDGKLVGLLTSENVGEFVLIQAALRGQPAPRRVG